MNLAKDRQLAEYAAKQNRKRCDDPTLIEFEAAGQDWI
jgi:hypothetical protein